MDDPHPHHDVALQLRPSGEVSLTENVRGENAGIARKVNDEVAASRFAGLAMTFFQN